nr:guanylate-binding protein 4-like [Tanacetum cinerariifolium]
MQKLNHMKKKQGFWSKNEFIWSRNTNEFSRFAEVQERRRNVKTVTKRATEMPDIASAEAVTAQKEKNEIQRVASDMLTEISRLEMS